MLIEQIMKTNVVTLTPDDTLEKALSISQTHRIRHLPVVTGGKLEGIISDRDLRDYAPSLVDTDCEDDVLNTKVSQMMKTSVITAHPLDFVEEAAGTMYEHRIGCLPVVRNGMLVGIVTESDLLHTLVELMGVNQPSSHIEIEVPDKTGMLAEIATLFKNHHINVASVLVYSGPHEGMKRLVFRVRTMDPRHVIEEIRLLGYKVLTP